MRPTRHISRVIPRDHFFFFGLAIKFGEIEGKKGKVVLIFRCGPTISVKKKTFESSTLRL
jgi:hypothetical protein